MKVEEFNTEKGLYIFSIDHFDTVFHSHPVIECIIANSGNFTLWTDSEKFQDLKFAIIDANKKHKLFRANGAVKIIMIEHHNKFVLAQLAIANINLVNGYYFQTRQEGKQTVVEQIIQSIKNGKIAPEYDERVSEAINHLNRNDVEYGKMIKTLKSVTHLSESRLSHLFKSNVGISLKKYLIWTKLKATIHMHLNNQDDIFSSLIKSGFYDHPHFSRNFKAMLGVKPSQAYNSRNLQVLPVRNG